MHCEPAPSLREATGRPFADRSVILIWLDGGPPQHETYDPKPEAPAEFRGPLKAISTAVPGAQVSELLPNHARLLDRVSLIRSMHHDNGRSLRGGALDVDRLSRIQCEEHGAAVSLRRLDHLPG